VRPRFSKAHSNYFTTKNMKITHKINEKNLRRKAGKIRRKNVFKYSSILKKFKKQYHRIEEEVRLPKSLDYVDENPVESEIIEESKSS